MKKQKVVSFILVIFMLAAGIQSLPTTVFATGGEDLQRLIDSTPIGGELTLTEDIVGHKNEWGYCERVTINNPITIKGSASNNRVKLDWIQFNIKADHVTLKNLRFEKGGGPHGIFIKTEGQNINDFNVIDCVFDTENNKNLFGEQRKAYDGGFIYLADCTQITFTKCKFKYGRAEYTGGAVYLNNIDGCLFYDCFFSENKAKSFSQPGTAEGGGSLYVKKSKNIEMVNCTFSDNVSERYGGATTRRRFKR